MLMRERQTDRSISLVPFEKKTFFSFLLLLLSPTPLPRTVCLSAGGFPSYVCESLALSSATESSARAVSTKSGAQLLAGFLTESERSDDDDEVDGEEEEEGGGSAAAAAASSSRGAGGTSPPLLSSSAIESKQERKERSFFPFSE